MRLSQDTLVKVIFFLSILIFIGLSWFFSQFTVDDAFITFRYGYNLVNHGVWNWNPYGERVESNTSFTYAVLSIIPALLKIEPQIFFKVFGLTIFLVIFYRLRELKDNLVLFSASVLLLISPFFIVHLYSGLETSLFIFICFEITRVSCTDKFYSNEKYFHILILLLPLTRPEGALISFAAVVGNYKKIKEWKFFSFIILLGIIYFLWRYFYFGYLFPNPFYLKSGNQFNIFNYANNIEKMLPYIIPVSLFSFFIFNKSLRIISFFSIIIMMLLYAKSNLLMNYADRFSMQITYGIILAIPFVLKEYTSQNNLYNIPYRNYSLSFLIVSLFLLFHKVKNEELIEILSYYPHLSESHKKIGEELEKYSDEDYTLMVGDAGIIPFYSNMLTYDYIGLCDNYISRNGINKSYLENSQPDIILLYTIGKNDNFISSFGFNQNTILNFINESKDYELVAYPRYKDYYLASFVRMDLKHFNQIKEELKTIEINSENFVQNVSGKEKLYALFKLKYIK